MQKIDYFKKFPVFDLDDIVLREISVEDAKNFLSYISNPHITKYLSSDDLPSNIDQSRNELLYWSGLFYRKASFYWAVADSKNNKIIGTCGFNNWSITHNRIEISYDLDFEYWGKGLMTKSVKKICEFAFDSLNVVRIQATVAEDNVRSIKLLERLGFTNEGLLKKYGTLNNQVKNFYMMALVN